MAEITFSKKQLTPIMEKYGISADDANFVEIISMFPEQTNYQIWAIKAVWGGNAKISDLVQIKEWASKNQTHIKDLEKGMINAYSSKDDFAKLFKEMVGIELVLTVKNVISQFNTTQRGWLTEYLFNKVDCSKAGYGLTAYFSESFRKSANILDKFNRIKKERKLLFIKKSSGYSSVNALMKGIEDCLTKSYDWNKESLLAYRELVTPKSNVVYDKDNIVIIEVNSFDDSKNLCGSGRTGWCITRELNYFKQYITDKKGNKQYFYFDFSLPENDQLSHIGFTVSPENGICNAHSTQNGSMLGSGININGKNVNIHDVFNNKQISSKVYIRLKQLVNYKWNKGSIEGVIKSKNFAPCISTDNLIVVRCLDRQAMNFLLGHTLINQASIALDDKNFVYVIINTAKAEDDEESIMALQYTSDRFGSKSLRNVFNAYNSAVSPTHLFESLGINQVDFLGKEQIAPEILLHKYIEENRENDAINLINENGDALDVNALFEKQAPVFVAIQKNMSRLFGTIINHPKFDYNTVDIFSESIFTSMLYDYLYDGNTNEEKARFESMINVILSSTVFDFNLQNLNLDTAVNIACQNPSLNWVAEALIAKENVNINVVNDFNCSALGCAITGGNTKAIELLATRPDFVVRDEDVKMAQNNGINLNEIIASVQTVAAR